MSYPIFVPITISSRRPRKASASCRSARPLPYASAASQKVTPCSSSARRIIATASASLLSPHQPVETVQVPKPTSLTRTSVLGNSRYFIGGPFSEERSSVSALGSRPAHQNEL